MALPELVFSSPDGGTIHRYELAGGKRVFLRFISCYLGNCRFYNNLEEASQYLENAQQELKLINGTNLT